MVSVRGHFHFFAMISYVVVAPSWCPAQPFAVTGLAGQVYAEGHMET